MEANPCPQPSAQEIEGELQSRAGSTARFYVQSSRVDESEAYRNELRGLPLGRDWQWYQEKLQSLGFTFRDATLSAMDRPRFCLVKNRLEFRLEITCDSRGRVTGIVVDPNL